VYILAVRAVSHQDWIFRVRLLGTIYVASDQAFTVLQSDGDILLVDVRERYVVDFVQISYLVRHFDLLVNSSPLLADRACVALRRMYHVFQQRSRQLSVEDTKSLIDSCDRYNK
jgi:hypothetical protein